MNTQKTGCTRRRCRFLTADLTDESRSPPTATDEITNRVNIDMSYRNINVLNKLKSLIHREFSKRLVDVAII